MFKQAGFDVFKEPTIEIDEDMAWELTAMSVSHLDAKGCYHMSAGTDGHLNVFVALMDVRSGKEQGSRGQDRIGMHDVNQHCDSLSLSSP